MASSLVCSRSALDLPDGGVLCTRPALVGLCRHTARCHTVPAAGSSCLPHGPTEHNKPLHLLIGQLQRSEAEGLACQGLPCQGEALQPPLPGAVDARPGAEGCRIDPVPAGDEVGPRGGVPGEGGVGPGPHPRALPHGPQRRACSPRPTARLSCCCTSACAGAFTHSAQRFRRHQMVVSHRCMAGVGRGEAAERDDFS